MSSGRVTPAEGKASALSVKSSGKKSGSQTPLLKAKTEDIKVTEPAEEASPIVADPTSVQNLNNIRNQLKNA